MKLKHYFKTIAAVVILMITVASAKGQSKTIYSMLSNGTLTFYYGTPTKQETSLTTYYDIGTNPDFIYSSDNLYKEHVIKVDFDPSMRNIAPQKMHLWFRNLSNLEEVSGMGYLSSSNLTMLDYMFQNCIKLRKVEFSVYNNGYFEKFSTSNITSMAGMFFNCKSLRALDLSTFSTSKVTDMDEMFASCERLETIIVGDYWDVTNVTRDYRMFYNNYLLKGTTSYKENCTSKDYATTNEYLKPSTTSAKGYAHYMFGTLTFYYDKFFNDETCYELNTANIRPDWSVKQCDNITKVVFDPSFAKAEPNTSYSWFYSCKQLTTIEGLKNLSLSKDTCFAYMFCNCSAIEKLDLSDLKVCDGAKNFSYMFYGCSKLSKLQMMERYNSSSNAYCSMSNMFAGSESLTSTGFLDNFYTSKATDMSSMFEGCSKIESFSAKSSISKYLITSACTIMTSMFKDCSSVTDFSILTTFNTKNVTKMNKMFSGCASITDLNLSTFNTENVTTIQNMFDDCTNLTTIYVSDLWSTESLSKLGVKCFANCRKLVGGKETAFADVENNAHLATFAHIDQGASDPGYFTPYSSEITYNLDGGSVSGNPTTYTVETSNFTLSNPTRAGYHFEGWSGTDIDGKSTSVTIKKGSSYPREYTAHWTCDLTSTSNTVKLVPSAEYYDNTPITLTVTVNGTTLRENIDFTTPNPIPVVNESGTYTVKITGIGDYTGTKSVSITIDALIDVTVTPDALSKTYGDDDPTEFTYTTVGLKSGDKLEGSLSRQSGEDAGKYLITGTLTNKKYRVTIDEVMFTINAKTVTSPTILLESDVYVFNDEAIEPKVSVLDGATLIPSNEYTVVYQNNRAIGTGNIVIVDKTGGNYTVSSSKDFQIVDKASAIEVTLITSEGNQTIYAVSGQKLTRPIREGYTAYLYTDADKTIEWDYDTDVITAPVTLYLELEPNLHYIEFNIDGAYPLPIMSIYYGEEITLPTLGKPGYTFSWLDTPPATMPDKDLEIRGTYTINKHNLVYLLDGKEYSSEQVEYDTPLTLKANPAARTGYTFSGWSDIPATMPDEDVKISGSFIVNKHNLIFNIDGVAQPAKQVEYAAILSSYYPRKAGFAFKPSGTYPTTMPDADLTISGNFQETLYTLSYYVNDELHHSEDHTYGDKIDPIAEPQLEGFTFSGWSEIPATMPDANVIVIGTFTQNSYTLTFKIDGEDYKKFTKHLGDPIVDPIVTTSKYGYTFSGWEEHISTMKESDLVINGSFIANVHTVTYMVGGEVYSTVETAYNADIVPPVNDDIEWSYYPNKMPNSDVVVNGDYKNGNPSTPVSSITNAPSVKIWAYNSTIYIETAPDSQYKIIDLQGRIITTSTTKSSHDEIHINQSGILVVIIGNQSFKLSL